MLFLSKEIWTGVVQIQTHTHFHKHNINTHTHKHITCLRESNALETLGKTIFMSYMEFDLSYDTNKTWIMIFFSLKWQSPC